MREIKFRGYAVDEMVNSQWLEGYGIYEVGYVSGKREYMLETSSGTFQVYEKSVGQYTGLNDKNGKEIYEGDVVRFSDNRLEDEGINKRLVGKVDFANGSFVIERQFSRHYRWLDYVVEVIGNKYENPELLEGE